jgi:hypothetical protein
MIYAYPKSERNPSMGKIDNLESSLDEASDQLKEIAIARIKCIDACRHELTMYARECERGGGNPGLDISVQGVIDIINDMGFDSLQKLDGQIQSASSSLSVEYRKQGVA